MSNLPSFKNVAVVGMHFRGEHAKKFAAELQPGDELFLEREPDNPYDQNAIKVMVFENGNYWHLGYINRTDAAWISPYLENPSITPKVEVERVAPAGTGKNTNLYPFVTITLEEAEVA